MTDSCYIHIPFCKYICTYCDFCKKYIKYQDVDLYLESLKKEMSTLENNQKLTTLYIGGGTPSSLSVVQLEKLFNLIQEKFEFKENYEFTFECNPDDINKELMVLLKKFGVNRISIGMQTTNDKCLSLLKREHTKKDCQTAIDIASEYFNNISVDFIFNLPWQTEDDIIKDLKFIEQNSTIKNVSYYGLILENNTILQTQEYSLFDEDKEATIYYLIQKNLNELGYNQYEISNFAKNGYPSIHNQVYWLGKEYYGFGLGASSYVDGVRKTNTSSIKDYNSQSNIVIESEELDQFAKDYEKIFLSLRTTKGLDLKLIKKYDLQYEEEDFILEDGYIHIRPEKFYISTTIILNILNQL